MSSVAYNLCDLMTAPSAKLPRRKRRFYPGHDHIDHTDDDDGIGKMINDDLLLLHQILLNLIFWVLLLLILHVLSGSANKDSSDQVHRQDSTDEDHNQESPSPNSISRKKRVWIETKCVCKSWNSIITDPLFSRLHCNPTPSLVLYSNSYGILETIDCKSLVEQMKRTDQDNMQKKSLRVCREIPWRRLKPYLKYIGRSDSQWSDHWYPGDLKIWGSCNGFLCLGYGHSNLKLWNPITGEVVEIPFQGSPTVCLGFGVEKSRDESDDDYKVVKVNLSYHLASVEIEVFSLRTGNWVRKTDQELDRNWFPQGNEKLLFCSGALHWLITSHNNQRSEFISAFDLAEEKCQQLPVPDMPDRFPEPRLGVLRGCLSLCYRTSGAWVVKMYREKTTWTEVARIPFPLTRRDGELAYSFLPLFLSEDGDIIALINDASLAKCNINDRRSRISVIMPLKKDKLAMYLDSSLVSLL